MRKGEGAREEGVRGQRQGGRRGRGAGGTQETDDQDRLLAHPLLPSCTQSYFSLLCLFSSVLLLTSTHLTATLRISIAFLLDSPLADQQSVMITSS